MTQSPAAELQAEFGGIDIYLFDQLLKGHFDRRRRVLDAGCGDGRNLFYFLRHGFSCYGIDRDEDAIRHVRALAGRLAPGLPGEHFTCGSIESLPWPDRAMDAVISSAVLHFCEDSAQF